MNTKNIVIIILLLAVIIAGGYFFINNQQTTTLDNSVVEQETTIVEVKETPEINSTEEQNVVSETKRENETNIGKSADNNNITAYHFGSGSKEILFVGGIHGGYSWNTSLLAYQLIDYLDANPNLIPKNVTVTIIPVLNPDGLKSTVGTFGRFDLNSALNVSDTIRTAGRFNNNDVDLNRNFDCEWSKTAVWQNKEVSGGTSAFSEPEAIAVRDYINQYRPVAGVIWFSAEGKVYPSACGGTPSNSSITLANTYGEASGYEIGSEFDAYNITGDMVNWMAKQNIPAISVLLSDHKTTEWEKNLAGVEAIIKAYAE